MRPEYIRHITKHKVAHTTHHPNEKGTSLYIIRETPVTRLRTGTDPYPGHVVSFGQTERIVCRMSDKRVKEIGVIAAYREEQAAFWYRVRHGEKAKMTGLQFDYEAQRDVYSVEQAIANDAAKRRGEKPDVDVFNMRPTDDPNTAIEFDEALAKVAQLPVAKREEAMSAWHKKHGGIGC